MKPSVSKNVKTQEVLYIMCSTFRCVCYILDGNFHQNISTLILFFTVFNKTKLILIYAATNTKNQKASKICLEYVTNFYIILPQHIQKHSRMLDCIEH